MVEKAEAHHGRLLIHQIIDSSSKQNLMSHRGNIHAEHTHADKINR